MSNDGKVGCQAFYDCDGIDSVHISNNGDIDTLAFYGCYNLQTAIIQNTGDIGSKAFYQCNNLQTVSIQNRGNIGSQAFYQCNNLQTATIKNDGFIGSKAFYQCTNLQTATIKNAGDIGSQAFYQCTKLQADTIQNDGNIGSEAFYGCQNLQTVTIQNNGYIGSQAFYQCTNLQTAAIQNNGHIGSEAFYGCRNLSNATLGDQITEIGYSAFEDCTALTEFVIPDSVVTLGTSAFENCSSMERISIGRGVPSLPERVFSGCASLDSLSIPNNVASINDYAFAGCSSLRDVFIEDAEQTEKEETISQSFPSWMSTNRTDNSTSHEDYTFSVSPGDKLTFNYSVSSEQGYDFLIITLDGAQIVKVSGSERGSYEKVFEDSGQATLQVSYTKDGSGQAGGDYGYVYDIWLNNPELITEEGALVLGSNGKSPLFADCPLDEVYIGRKLSYNTGASYGYSPFYQNTSLRTVEITDAETQIYDNEFYGCSNLASLKIGNGVTAIGNWAFSGCSSLDYFSAGYLVETIGTEAFSDCTGLSKFYAYSIVPPVCGDQALDDINKWDCTLYVPDESTDEYQAAPQWKEFFFMEEMEAVLVAEIRLDLTGDTLAPNDTVRLTAQVLPANATDPTLLWSSSDESIATVDETGLVTALATGTATITAKSQDGNAEAMCTITVEDENVTGIDAIFEEDSKIEVFNMYGHKVGNSTEDLPTGVYIIKEGNKTYKKVIR